MGSVPQVDVLPSFYVDWIRSMRHGFWGGADAQMAPMPADFLVGPDGCLLRAHYGSDIGDHLCREDIGGAVGLILMVAGRQLDHVG